MSTPMRLRSIVTVLATVVSGLAVTAATASAEPVAPHDSLLVDPASGNPYSYAAPGYAGTATEDPATGALTLKMGLAGSTSYFHNLTFTPPTGQQFTAGQTYLLQGTADATHAGVSIPCAPTGSFTVVDVTRDATPAVTSVGVDYDFRCPSATTANYHSFRWQSTMPDRGATYAFTNSSFPRVEPGQSSPAITYTVVGSGPGGTTVGGVSIAGVNPLDFTITSNGCIGQVLARKDTCPVAVAFTPTAAYTRTAELVIANNSQRGERRLALNGYAYGPPGAVTATATDRSDGVQLRWQLGHTGGRALEYVEVLRGDSADTLVHLAQIAPGTPAFADRLGSDSAPLPDHEYVYGIRAHTDHGDGPITTVTGHIPAAASPSTADAIITVDPDYRAPTFSARLRVYDAAAGSTITVAPRSSGGLEVNGRTPGDLTAFFLQNDGSPYGTELTTASYSHPFYLGSEAGLFGCSPEQTALDISELAYDSTGAIARMAADYTYRCDAGGPAVAGAIRWHSDAPYTAVNVTTPASDFPVKVNQPQTLLVTYRNVGTRDVTVSAAALQPSTSGGSTSGWVLTSNPCAGAALAPQAQCTATITATTSSLGHREVLLRFTDDTVLGSHTRKLSVYGVQPPPAPTGLRAVSAGTNGTTVRWLQYYPTQAAPSQWQVFRKVGTGSYSLIKTVTATGAATSGSYTDPDLRSGSRSYLVRAVNIAGVGPSSAALPVLYGVQPPRAVVAVGLTRRVVVTWSPPIASITAAPLSGYAISRVSSTGALVRLGTRGARDNRSFPAAGLTPGQRVTVKVQALFGTAPGPAVAASGTASSSSLLVVRSDGRLYGRALGGGASVSVDQPRTFSYEPLLEHSTAPAFSPDRRWIVCSVSNGAADYPYKLIVRRTDGSGSPRILTTGPDFDVSPAVSRDGKWVAFLRVSRSTGRYYLYRVPFAGGTPTIVPSSANLDEPTWAADGKSLIATNIATNALGIYRITLTGTRTRVGGSGRNHAPAVSPDGKTLAFATTSATTRQSTLKRLTLSTGSLRTLSSTGGMVWNVSWTPDSVRLYYIVLSTSSSATSLRRINRDGSGLTSLASLGSTARLVLYEQW